MRGINFKVYNNKKIDFGEVFFREGIFFMCILFVVCVNNDFFFCNICVILRVFNYKCFRRLKMVDCFIVKIFSRDNFL